jgi:hypothetical protein
MRERGVAEIKPLHEFVGEFVGDHGGRSVFSFVDGFGEFEGVSANLPASETVLFPGIEVLFGDGLAFEIRSKDCFNGGLGVDPFEKKFVGHSVVETGVKFVADGARESGDFSIHRLFIICEVG